MASPILIGHFDNYYNHSSSAAQDLGTVAAAKLLIRVFQKATSWLYILAYLLYFSH